jgi:hypothetical protein
MPSQSNISPSGTIQNFLNLGFTQTDALCELIDNSLDANARRIQINLNSKTHTITLADNGCGMDKADLTSALRINATKPASEMIGLRGVGLKAGNAVLSQITHSTLIFSQKKDCDVFEVELDWSGTMTSDVWNPVPHSISARNLSLWNNNKIEGLHGTITVNQMTKDSFESLLKYGFSYILKEIGRTYEQYISEGVIIQIVLDGEEHLPDLTLAINWSTVPPEFRTETSVKILRHPTTDEKRIYWLHSSYRPVWTDMVRQDPQDKKKLIRDQQEALAEGFIPQGEFRVRSAYKPEWNPPHPSANGEGVRPTYVKGFIAPCRDKRFLRPIDIEYPSRSDHEWRRIHASSRHSIDFSHTYDSTFGVQVNKSDVTRDNIDTNLIYVVEKLTSTWSKKLYDKHFKTQRNVGANAEFDRKMKQATKKFKEHMILYGEHFIEEYQNWVETSYEDDEYDEEIE